MGFDGRACSTVRRRVTIHQLAWACSSDQARCGILTYRGKHDTNRSNDVLTVCHVRPTAALDVIADLVRRRQSEISKLDNDPFPILVAVIVVSRTRQFFRITADKVLGLDVSMTDSNIVTECDSLTHLAKHGGDQLQSPCREQGIGRIRGQQTWRRRCSGMAHVSAVMIVRQVTLGDGKGRRLRHAHR
jgi:hypothetical protein